MTSTTDRDVRREADAVLATRVGVALVAAGEASGRLTAAAEDLGVLLCLTGHAVREARRRTGADRLAVLGEQRPAWLRRAAAEFLAAVDLDGATRPATSGVHRQVDDGVTGLELTDAAGRARSVAEEADAHLRTFTADDRRRPVRRWRADETFEVAVLDGPDDWEAAGRRVPHDVDGVHLTLRGLLTIEPPDRAAWPWRTAGVVWNTPVPGTPLPDDETGQWHHDHDWVAIGREFDPTFEEGDEVDGSELAG